MMDANVESIKNLQENLIKNNLNPRTIPLILQFNKRDLPSISTCEDLNNALRYRLDTPYFEAAAIEGRGVNETLKAAVSVVIKNLNKGISCELEPGVKPAVELGPGMKKREPKPAPEAKAAKKAAKAAQAPKPAEQAASSPAPEAQAEEEGEVKYEDLSEEVAEIEAEGLEELPEDTDEEEPEEADPAPRAASPVLPEEVDASDREEYLRSLYESNKRQLALIEEALKTLQQEQAVLEKLLKS
jgi:hypothetical protein